MTHCLYVASQHRRTCCNGVYSAPDLLSSSSFSVIFVSFCLLLTLCCSVHFQLCSLFVGLIFLRKNCWTVSPSDAIQSLSESWSVTVAPRERQQLLQLCRATISQSSVSCSLKIYCKKLGLWALTHTTHNFTWQTTSHGRSTNTHQVCLMYCAADCWIQQFSPLSRCERLQL